MHISKSTKTRVVLARRHRCFERILPVYLCHRSCHHRLRRHRIRRRHRHPQHRSMSNPVLNRSTRPTTRPNHSMIPRANSSHRSRSPPSRTRTAAASSLLLFTRSIHRFLRHVRPWSRPLLRFCLLSRQQQQQH